MADTAKKAAPAAKATPAKAEGKKRKMLTPEQRIAKLEADLAAAKAKAEKQANKAADQLLDKRSKLTKRVNDLLDQIAALDAELATKGITVGAITERVEDIDTGTYV